MIMDFPALSLEMLGVIVLSVILAVVLVAYDRLLRRVQQIRHEEEKFEEKARRQAEKIVELAKIRAERMVTQATTQGRQLQHELEEMVASAGEAQIGEYKQKLQNISIGIEGKLEQGMEEFGKLLEMETIASQRAVTKRLQGEYQKIESELSEYKQSRMKEIESKLRVGLEKGLKKAMGEAFNEQDSENLIMRAIEEAKKQHVI